MNSPAPNRTISTLTPPLDEASAASPGVLAGLPPGPLTAAEVARVAPGSAERAHYRRIWHGMYRREDQADDLLLRSRALVRTFPDGVLRGRSAALLWGDDSIPHDAPPEIWLPTTRRTSPGRVYRFGVLPTHAITEVDGLPVTTPLRTCRDLAADLEFEDAVVSIERLGAMVAELPGQLRAAAAHPSGRQARLFEQVVGACDFRSDSALLSRARLVLAAAGCGYFGHGHQVALGEGTVDLPLADPGARCVVYMPTGSSQRRGRLSRQQSHLQHAGWTVIIVREQQNATSDAAPRAAQGAASGAGPAGGVAVPRRAAALLAQRWLFTELRLPARDGSTADPHGLWRPSRD